MKFHVYETEELVIGYGLNAVLYAFFNNCLILLNKQEKPYVFDKWKNHSKKDIWEEKIFALSLAGKCPLADKIESIRIDNNIAKVTTNNQKLIQIQFKKLRIFDGEKVYGLSFEEKIHQYAVYDWFNVRSGTNHGINCIFTPDNFVKCMRFYPSDRIDGNHNKKDLVVESLIDKDNLNKFEYSDTYVRLKALNIMRKYGVRGRRNGKSKENPSKYKYYALRAELDKRYKTKKIREFVTFGLPKSVIFDITNEEAFLDHFCNNLGSNLVEK